MLLGYVSDERYLALAGVEIEILGPHDSLATRSRASGSVHADIEPGRYEIILAKDGYGSKRVTVDFHNDLNKRGFSVSNPSAKSTCGCGSSFSM